MGRSFPTPKYVLLSTKLHFEVCRTLGVGLSLLNLEVVEDVPVHVGDVILVYLLHELNGTLAGCVAPAQEGSHYGFNGAEQLALVLCIDGLEETLVNILCHCYLLRLHLRSLLVVKALLCGREATLPLPGDLYPYYRWSDFRKFYRNLCDNARIAEIIH